MPRMTRALCAGLSALLGLALAGTREAGAAIPTAERDALVLLYTSTGGPLWTNQANWLGPVGTECTWYGIVCDAGATTVLRINLFNNALSGTLPTALSNLANLQYLYLGANQLTGVIPSTLGNLASLLVLELNGNQLGGSIPSTLGNLANLQVLYLVSNQLTGAIPSTLGNLTNLQNLALYGNQLTGAVPPTLGNLTNLRWIQLDDNQLTGAIPSALGNMTSLQYLDLHSNQLTGAIPSTLGNLTNLLYLRLDSNQLDGAIPPTLGNLTNLTELNLSSNRLTGAIPPALGNMTELEDLYLSSNQLTGVIPSSLGNLAGLACLMLDSNRLTGAIPSTLGNVTGLNALSLRSNKLTGAIPATFGNLTNVWDLDLRGNRLTGAIPPALGKMTNLKNLRLNGNQLTGAIPPALSNLTSLRILGLGTNKLTGAIPSSLGSLANLQQLELYSNQLTGAIPQALGYLANLQLLYLFGNRLTGAIPSSLGSLTMLQELDLNSNALSGPIPTTLGSLTNLNYLDLSNNKLTDSIPAILGNLANLQYLSLKANKLTGPIPAILGSLTKLQGLLLSHNQLTGTIPPELGNLTNLMDLDLGDNRLAWAIPPELGALSKLSTLSLKSNALQGSIPLSLTNLTALTSLDIRWNALSSTDPTLTAFLTQRQFGWQDTQTVAPTNLMVIPATATSVTLTWTPERFTETWGGYLVLMGSSAGGPYAILSRSSPKSGISTTVTGLVPGSTGYFILKTQTEPHANNQNWVESDISMEAAGTTYTLEPVQFSAATYKVSEAAPLATITVKRSGALTDSATVDYQTSQGTASSGVDYQPRTGTLTFNPHVPLQTFSVPILADPLDEPDETVLLRLQNPVNCVVGPQGTAVLTIADNDAASVIQFSPASYAVSESAGSARITVRRTGGTAANVSVSYSAFAGTATPNVDFVPVSGSLTFAAGQAVATFDVPIWGDAIAEGAETVNLALSAPSNGARLGTYADGLLTIVDDESTVELGAGWYSVTEGGTAALAVKRTGDLSGTATVHYATVDGTAIAGTNYTAASGTLTFGPRVASRVVWVRTTNDTLWVSPMVPKTFSIALDTPTGGVALGHQGNATVAIKDNDPAGVVQFSATSYKVAEHTGPTVITLTRTGGTASSVTVHYSTSAGTATPGADYLDISGIVPFAANQTRASFQVPILDDVSPEAAETLLLSLDTPTGGATLGTRTSATLAIADNDLPAFRFSAETYRAGEAARKAVITVRREGDLTQQASVWYSTSDGTARATQDFEPVSGWVVFAPRVAAQTFTVPILDDALDEPDEILNLTLSAPSAGNGLGWPSTAILTIVDNDKAGTVQFLSPVFSVVDSGTPQQALITVTRKGGTAGGATVDYATTDGTATAGLDYVAASGTLPLSAGQTRATFPVQINGDSVVEGNETVHLELWQPQGCSMAADHSATLWIADPLAAAKLVFVHGASGRDWLADDQGGLAAALRDNNYFVSDTCEDWGPPYSDGTSTIGAHTDIGEWWEWFRGPSSATHLKALYREQGQRSDYARLEDPDPTRENEIVLIQSSFANSHLSGLPTDPPTAGANALRGQPSWSGEMTVGNAKGIYNDILEYFRGHPEKLFVVVTAPPLTGDETTPEEAANARALNEWLVNDWLEGYSQKNVAVLDFFGTLTSNGGSANENDLGAETGSHHRWWSGAVQHVNAESDVSAYAESVTGSQPTTAGMEKATVELVTLLNYYRNRWKGLPADAQAGANALRDDKGTHGPEAIAPPGRRARRP